MRLLCFNKFNLILRRPRSGRLEGWPQYRFVIPGIRRDDCRYRFFVPSLAMHLRVRSTPEGVICAPWISLICPVGHDAIVNQYPLAKPQVGNVLLA